MTQGIQDVIAGRVHLVILAVPAARGHIAAGKLNALAVTSGKRLDAYPNVPTVAETFAGFDFAGWWILAAPPRPGSDSPARQQRNGRHPQGASVGGAPEQNRFVSRGGGTLQQTSDYVKSQHAAWGNLVKQIGLKPE